MYALKAQVQGLMDMPDRDGTTAGPTFEYIELGGCAVDPRRAAPDHSDRGRPRA
jgi:hypothetical protein